MKKKKGFLCWMGWHSPSPKIGFDGCSFMSTCRRCGMKILQDSQGNWFAASNQEVETDLLNGGSDVP